MTRSIFISSSSDLAALREDLRNDLHEWLSQHGFAQLLKPYLWEEDKEDGRLWSDRQRIQSQLPDPAGPEVPLTICLFGERCGSPLEDELDPVMSRRFESWRAKGDEPGVLHPWPSKPDEQELALARGQYPLTGTVFELISAHTQSEDADNLIVACLVDRPVMPSTAAESVVLNCRKLHARLTAGRSKSETKRIETEVYDPQASALLNLLKDHARKVRFVAVYPSEDVLRSEVFGIAQEKLRQKLGIASLRNPFKQSLAHWTVEDEKQLPGRTDVICDIVAAMTRHGDLVLLKGRSGCGKSSLMQSGVMRRLREVDGSVPVPFRPTELMFGSGEGDALDKLIRLIAETAGVPRPAGGPMAMRPNNYAKRLEAALEKNNINLVLGFDQFEEVIDELKLERDRGTGTPQSGWWLVIRFLNALCRSRRVRLIATLESAREKSFENLRIGEAIGLMPKTCNVDATDDTIAEIARSGFARGGLPLESAVVEAIKRRWREFERQAPSDNASPLPLAALLFHRLYERFADQAGATADERLESAFKHAGARDDQFLTLEEIGGEDAIAFADIIQNLADEAWHAGGGKTDFDDPIETDGGFRLLNNFLKSLVAVDHDGHIQLRAAVEVDANEGTRRMRRAFRERRLLVPVPGEGAQRLRPAHQALIDRWSPARRWFAFRKQPLQTVQRFREDAVYWRRRGKPMPMEDDGSTLRAAALTLYEHFLGWRMCKSGELDQDDALLREQALTIFDTAEDPFTIIESSPGRTTYVALAAQYHRVGLLERFVAADAHCLEMKDADGENLLYMAAWSNGPAVSFLIEKGLALKTEGKSFSAIVIPIWENLNDNFDQMVSLIGLDDPIETAWESKMIHIAAKLGNAHVVDYLLGHGAILDIQDKYGRTALHYAAERDQADAFGRLLPHIEIQEEDLWKGTAVSMAAQSGASKVLSSYMTMEADSDRLSAVLWHKDRQGDTPLMIAARWHQLGTLYVLLQLDLGDLGDPSNEAHRGENGDTLLHLVFRGSSNKTATEADRFNVRAVVEALLRDGRLDPNLCNKRGETPFDLGGAFPEARRVLRRDSRVPNVYSAMTSAMRIEDLSSRRPATVLRLLKQAPQALTDEHKRISGPPVDISTPTEGKPLASGKGLKGETGLEILIRLKNHAVLALLVNDPTHWPTLREKVQGVIFVAAVASADRLRDALLRRFAEGDIEAAEAGALLGASVDAEDARTACALVEHGVPPTLHRDEHGQTVLHRAAIAGDPNLFRWVIAIGPFELSRDNWGRRPSDMAAETLKQTFRELEADMDDWPRADALPVSSSVITGNPPFLILELDGGARAANTVEIAILQRDWNRGGDLDAFAIRVFDLPFYAKVRLIEVRPRWPSAARGRVCFLFQGDTLFKLNGTSQPIHEVNGEEVPILEEETVLQYLSFFCFFVRGEEGPFLIVDRPEHSFLPCFGDRSTDFTKTFRPPTVWGKNEQGCWLVSGLVYYGDAIFVADFTVRPGGMIEMVSDTPIVANLPTRVSVPLDME